LGTLLLVIVASFFLAGQPWYEVTMSPNDEELLLKSFDGFSAYGWLSPMLLVCLAAAAVAALINGLGSRLVLCFGFLVSTATAFLTANAVAVQDLTGVKQELESATGVAATHGISGLGIQSTQFAFLSSTSLCLVAAVYLYSLITQASWVITPSSVKAPNTKTSMASNSKPAKPIRSKSTPKDSISIWDEQR
jgi:hypothetical protein